MKYPVRLLAFILAITLAVPHSALALRQTGLEESPHLKQKMIAQLTTGLEENKGMSWARKNALRWLVGSAMAAALIASYPLLQKPAAPPTASVMPAEPAPSSEPKSTPTAPAGKAYWIFDYHGRAEMQKLPARLEAILAENPGRRMILVTELSGPSLQEIDELLGKPQHQTLRREWEDVQAEINRLDRQRSFRIFKPGENLPIDSNEEVKAYTQRNRILQKIFGFLQGDLKTSRDLLRQKIEKGENLATLLDKGERGDYLFLAQHPEIQWEIEPITISSHLGFVEARQLYRRAIRYLYQENDRGNFLIGLAGQWFIEQSTNTDRDRTFGLFVQQILKENPGAVVVTVRGDLHRDVVLAVDHQATGFEKKVFSPPAVMDTPFREAMATLSAAERDRLKWLGPKRAEKEFPPQLQLAAEIENPWQAIAQTLEVTGEVDSTHRIHQITTQIFDRVIRDKAVPRLTAYLQKEERRALQNPKEFEEIPPDVQFMISVSLWLKQEGYLKGFEDKFPPRLFKGGLEENAVELRRALSQSWNLAGLVAEKDRARVPPAPPSADASPSSGLEEKTIARMKLEQVVQAVGEETIKLLAEPNRVIILEEEIPALKEPLQKAGYSGIARLVPTSLLPQAQQVSNLTVLVRGSQKETVVWNLTGKVAFTDEIGKANLVIGDAEFDPSLKTEYLASRQGPFLEVSRADVAQRITLEFLTNLQVDGLFLPGSILLLDRLVSGDLGETVLVFA